MITQHPVIQPDNTNLYRTLMQRLHDALRMMSDRDRPEEWVNGLKLATDTLGFTALGPLWAQLLSGNATATEVVRFALGFARCISELDASRFTLQPYIAPDEAFAGMTVLTIVAADAKTGDMTLQNFDRIFALIEKLANISGPTGQALWQHAAVKTS